ncbi:MAG TPA: DUF4097 family beta strand repeat-containing protein [Actinoallomurus sp.]|nr:DUF4097 family beta strand repeat-containing protein [Actinoallomurus sp.]
MPIFETPEPITAVIEITAGRVQINASDRADTVVDVRPRDETRDIDVHAAEQTQVEYAGGQLSVRAPKNKLRSLLGRPPSIEVTIEVPSDSRVDAKGWADYRSEGRIGESSFDTAAGNIRLDQTGGLKLRTAAGNVSVGRSNGHTDVSTSSGKIWIGEIDGAAVVKTANGDITVGEVTDDVRLNTANGDITVHRALAAVSAKTAFGGVRIGEVVRGTVVLETSFGELELGVREGTAAWLDVNSQHGSVRSDLEASDGPEASADTVKVRARTGYGDIVIRRP